LGVKPISRATFRRGQGRGVIPPLTAAVRQCPPLARCQGADNSGVAEPSIRPGRGHRFGRQRLRAEGRKGGGGVLEIDGPGPGVTASQFERAVPHLLLDHAGRHPGEVQ
jgi:hypothetical protein